MRTELAKTYSQLARLESSFVRVIYRDFNLINEKESFVAEVLLIEDAKHLAEDSNGFYLYSLRTNTHTSIMV